MTKPWVRLFVLAQLVLAAVLASSASAQCVPECRTGYICNPDQQCVSICNPPCGSGQICTAEAQCIDDPNAQQGYPQQQQQGYAQPQQPPQPQPVAMPVDQPPPAPTALSAPGSFRLLLTFDPGFGGGGTVDAGSFGSSDFDLDPTLGARVQAQIPIGDLLFFGFNFGVDGYIGEGAPSSADRVILIGLGPVIGFHYAVSLGSVTLEPTAGLALDFAIATADDVALDDSEFGFGLGFRGGLNVWFTEIVGAQVNIGVQTHQLFGSSGGQDFRFGLTQFRLGVGLILRFGAEA